MKKIGVIGMYLAAAGLSSMSDSSLKNLDKELKYTSSNDPYKKRSSGKIARYSNSEMKTIKKRRNKNKAAKKARKKNRR